MAATKKEEGMTHPQATLPAETGHWWALALRGTIAILFGLAALLRPGIAVEALILLFGAFALLGLTAFLLLYLIAAWAIVTGISEIVMAIRLRKEISSEWAVIVGGAFSVLFGVILAVVGPVAGLLSLVWLIGIYAVAFGIMLLIAGFRLRSEESGNADKPSRVI